MSTDSDEKTELARPPLREDVDWSRVEEECVLALSELEFQAAKRVSLGFNRSAGHVFDAVLEALYGREIWDWVNYLTHKAEG